MEEKTKESKTENTRENKELNKGKDTEENQYESKENGSSCCENDDKNVDCSSLMTSFMPMMQKMMECWAGQSSTDNPSHTGKNMMDNCCADKQNTSNA